MAKSKIDELFDDIFSSEEKQSLEEWEINEYRISPAFAIFDEPLEKDNADDTVSTTRSPSENFLYFDYPVIDTSKNEN
ncbi:MAG: hypothetical protein K2J27_07865 [Duncaniella sp.]|nr:hypothetical protein [Duncaniella sp.]